MKKLLLILLILCASIMPVHADEGYTITIPSTINVNTDQSISYSVNNGYILDMSVSSTNGNKLKNGSDILSYTPSATSWNGLTGTSSISYKATLGSNVPIYAGKYTDTLVFALSCEKKPNAKYAVAIYGIGQDVDSSGKTMGLTFGPALGANCVILYKSHTPSGNTASGNAHRCVHNDDWETIVHWNNVDPNVYEQCISKGCTHSVELYLNETLFNSSFKAYNFGDGPSMLYQELRTNSTNYQHLEWNPLQATGSTENGNNVGGWGASRIRAMMNGADSLTQTGTTYGTSVTGNYLPTMAATDYNSTNSLLSCFPSVLQNAIGSRKTIYHGTYNSNTQSICYDKLFLLSQQEVSTSTVPQRANEGTTYAKFASGSHLYYSNDTSRVGYRLSSNTDTSGVSDIWWLRSPNNGSADLVYGVSDAGSARNNRGACYGRGVSPAFALSR